MSKTDAISITIMDKEYRVACPPEERDNLLASAALLNEKLKEIKTQGSVIGTERIAIMAALNMSHEILHSKQLSSDMNDLDQRIESLSERISKTMCNIQLI